MYQDKHKDHKCFCIKEYAEAYVLPQVYENLFSVENAFKKGTIFMDLYRPYHQKESIH
ncbi:spore coat associated protein CotJA [Clostridium cylindrosporum]|uniref:Spore coat associated protein CotJA n=1 Tax=Clostridium cylindrosporum DSM 605 TaxID=1121307 RepID=A0A0J8DBJ0_CLOCY|nr:spore coat associated protein CotJA [Clostridium cylindrosporum]KMT23212.1 hypothetical protein CLCY_6c00930 [Clostridium cylindrosporum DSM 605]